MGWFSYNCDQHGNFTVSLEKREKKHHCPVCGADSKVVIKFGTVQVKEILDNGAMARSVERLHNIEDIMNERADKFSRQEEGETE